MKDRNEENLRDLFARFVDSEQANEAADDIERGEELLRRWAAPEPSNELLAQIKGQMAGRVVRSGRRHVRWFASRAAGIAAAFVIIASVWTGLNREGGPGVASAGSLIPTAIWESDNLAADDLNLASFTAEVERIESELKSLLLDEGSSGESVLNEAEIELMDIQGEFWKG
jgi:hypothetical protein